MAVVRDHKQDRRFGRRSEFVTTNETSLYGHELRPYPTSEKNVRECFFGLAGGLWAAGSGTDNTGHSGTILTGGEGVPMRVLYGYRNVAAPTGPMGVLQGVLGPTKVYTRVQTWL